MSINVLTSGPVYTVTIDRPERRNAIDQSHAQALADAFSSFEDDPKAQVAVLFGAGDNFCAGADLKAISKGQGNLMQESGNGPMGPTRMHLCKPVIAAVSGYAVAGGLELALWCDLRVVEQDAVFGVFCRRWGVPLVDGGTVRLPRIVGHGRAMDMILSGRPVQADEALRIGLADRVVANGCALASAQELAAQIAAFPQACLRSDRMSALQQWDLSHDEAMNNEFTKGLEVVTSGETIAGAARFSSGRGRHGAFENS